MTRTVILLTIALLALVTVLPIPAQMKKEQIPHGQKTMPGPALAPQEALKKMTVPDGFTVELVAAEPDLVNPVGMTFDERGRIWVVESLEYPRSSAGPGKDRVKVLESTRGDGIYDKITIFAEGLNIPSGIAVGHGGVWVANSPDILFYKIGPDGKAAGKPEVVVTGFGRADTHELPNSLTWGPDGWLYGLNGVFNPSHVRHRGKDYKFTCAMFRIHPRTKDFELFCEGTSNPWGIAFDTEGSAFVSACVVDHLWHLVQTGYYHRQGGPYPPFTWKLGSIVKHKHQQAAYCGLVYFDSDAYPAEYREKLYMGNIHGNCINCDELTRDGSTYFAKLRPDFLSANDAWFMPVSQKVGPDGCLYVLDWYDRYHCYQDARRDPQGIDRLRGRLYRVRYKGTPPAGKFDLGRESDEQLITRLHSPNIYFRDIAQRLLTERLAASGDRSNLSPTQRKLQDLVFKEDAPRKARMHALWVLVGAGRLHEDFHLRLIEHKDPTFRAWAVRAAGNMGKVEAGVLTRLTSLVHDRSADVKLQWAIASTRIEKVDPITTLNDVLKSAGNDRVIPVIVWQNLHPLLTTQGDKLVQLIEQQGLHDGMANLLPRVAERLLLTPKGDAKVLGGLVKALALRADPAAARRMMAMLEEKVQDGEIKGARLETLKKELLPLLRELRGKEKSPLAADASILALTLGDENAQQLVLKIFISSTEPEARRLQAWRALLHSGQNVLVEGLFVSGALDNSQTIPLSLQGQLISALRRVDQGREKWVSDHLLGQYPRLHDDLKARAIELLIQRAAWSRKLLEAIGEKKVPTTALNINQVRLLQSSKDKTVVELVRKHWGTVRDSRNPEREKVVAQMRRLLTDQRGDPMAGLLVYRKHCAVCHKMYGEGQDVGPDITVNGRSDFDQLLSNVFDPNLAIGTGYLATVVTTKGGEVLQGLAMEDNEQRVVLKMQGGELKTVVRGDVESAKLSKVSFMPEQFEQQLQPQEIIDLFAFLCLDRPPGDPKAKWIRGTPLK